MTSPVIGTPWKKLNAPVSEEALEGVDKYWRVANYLSIGQIYLRSNPLMKEPFTREDVKHRLVGHWGTTPGLNFLIGHINRFIADHGQNTVIIMGPGHGGPAGTSQSYLDGTYTETFPKITKDEAGLQKFFRQFSYPGGIPSHFAPETPGSIHEGGELGYALSHAYGAIMDNPSLFVPAIVGDGEVKDLKYPDNWSTLVLKPGQSVEVTGTLTGFTKDRHTDRAKVTGTPLVECPVVDKDPFGDASGKPSTGGEAGDGDGPRQVTVGDRTLCEDTPVESNTDDWNGRRSLLGETGSAILPVGVGALLMAGIGAAVVMVRRRKSAHDDTDAALMPRHAA